MNANKTQKFLSADSTGANPRKFAAKALIRI